MINNLAYYVKMGKVAHEIEDTIDRLKNNKPIQVLGLPRDYTPEELLNFQKEKLKILDVAARSTEQTVREWIECIKLRVPRNVDETFRFQTEKELLELGLQ